MTDLTTLLSFVDELRGFAAWLIENKQLNICVGCFEVVRQSEII